MSIVVYPPPPGALPVRFTVDEANAAATSWGFNCGPGAIAGVLGYTPAELRPRLGDFERKGYTNPSLMWEVLDGLGVTWRRRTLSVDPRLKKPFWPLFGFARIQWEGPWTAPGVPIAARYRRTHWVGGIRLSDEVFVFDINCLCVGGWVPLGEWSSHVVPWILEECQPKADGRWHITHQVEVKKPGGGR
jgi:hypothetical protein